ncbi:hypothetical protein KKB44_03215 [Candidatus Micrarchaeota archaeon]|nr:hypothetical protein [Candidatus Micrarchaeota archaeon]
MRTITIVSNDKVGLLADISYVLAKEKVNIESISADVISGKGIITLTLSDAEKGKEVLESAGFKVEELNSVVVKLDDKPGELNRITSSLSKEGVNIQNVHMISKDGKTTVLSLMVDNPRKTALILKDNLLANESVY